MWVLDLIKSGNNRLRGMSIFDLVNGIYTHEGDIFLMFVTFPAACVRFVKVLPGFGSYLVAMSGVSCVFSVAVPVYIFHAYISRIYLTHIDTS